MIYSSLKNPLVLLLLAITSYGYSQQSYTLKQAQDYAIDHAYQNKLATAEVQINEQAINGLKALLFPQIGASAGFTHYIDIPTSVAPVDAFGFPSWFNEWIGSTSSQTGVFPNIPVSETQTDSEFQELQFGSKYNSSVGISASQLIFDGSYFVGLKAIKTSQRLVEKQKAKSELDTKESVADAYYTVLVAQENLKTLKKSKKVLEQTVNETKAFFENGLVEDITLDQLQLSLSTLENSIKNAEMQSNLSLDILRYRMGMPLTEQISLADSLSSFTSNIGTDVAEQAINISNHPDFLLMEANLDLMRLNKKAEQMKIAPTLAANFNYQQNAFSNDFSLNGGSGFFPTTLWGLNLNIPIFGGGIQRSKIKSASLDIEKAEIQKIQTEEGLKLGQKTAKTSYLNALATYETEKKNLALAEKIKSKTEIKFKEGLASSIELTQTQNQYLQTQGTYIGSLFQLVKSKLQLEKSLGKL